MAVVARPFFFRSFLLSPAEELFAGFSGRRAAAAQRPLNVGSAHTHSRDRETARLSPGLKKNLLKTCGWGRGTVGLA